MKSKAHSKKCMEMGVPEVLVDDQDAEDSGIYPLTETQKETIQNNIYICICSCFNQSAFYIWLSTPGHLKTVLPVN